MYFCTVKLLLTDEANLFGPFITCFLQLRSEISFTSNTKMSSAIVTVEDHQPQSTTQFYGLVIKLYAADDFFAAVKKQIQQRH